MPSWKEGDRVRVVSRPVTDEDRKKNRYFEHMAGLTGTVQNVYGVEEIAVKIDISSVSNVSRQVHKTAVDRMREKFLSNISEEQKKQLTPEELNFSAHYMLLVRGEDLQAEQA
jgi:ribosomal protein L21E